METCTSGSEEGIGKPNVVTHQGVWCLSYETFEQQARRYSNEKAMETEMKSKADARLQAEIMAAQQGGQPGF